MASATTLVLGAGTGGIVCANTLRRLLPEEHRIVLVDKTGRFVLGATKPWVMMGERTPGQITHSLDALSKRRIDVKRATVQRIDPEKREVVTDRGQLRGDYMVIALGADYNMAAVDGLARAAQTFYTVEGAARLRDTLRSIDRGDILLLIPRAPFKCPPAPYEGAMLIQNILRKRGVTERVRLSVTTVEGAPMATAGPEIGKFVRDSLIERGIAYNPLKRTKSVDHERNTVLFEDGSEAKFDLLIAVPPHEAPRAARDSGLLNPAGWIPVDPKTLAMQGGDPNRIYAIGDITSVPLPGRFKPENPLVLPKAGVFADGEAKIVAERIAAHVLGKEVGDSYGGKGFCYIEMGDGHAVRGDGSFFDLPHPSMSRKVPDLMQLEEKHAWVANWLKSNLG